MLITRIHTEYSFNVNVKTDSDTCHSVKMLLPQRSAPEILSKFATSLLLANMLAYGI